MSTGYQYHIKPTEKPRRARAEILDPLHALLVELRRLES